MRLPRLGFFNSVNSTIIGPAAQEKNPQLTCDSSFFPLTPTPNSSAIQPSSTFRNRPGISHNSGFLTVLDFHAYTLLSSVSQRAATVKRRCIPTPHELSSLLTTFKALLTPQHEIWPPQRVDKALPNLASYTSL